MPTLTIAKRRRGALMVETAFVLPILLLLLLGVIVGGLGIFRYQLVAYQASEAARYASVHGADWEADTDSSPLTRADIIKYVVLPLANTMDTSKLSVQVDWVDRATGKVYEWDASSRSVKSLSADGEYVTANVRVTVTYEWVPEVFLGTCRLSSVCELPMAN